MIDRRVVLHHHLFKNAGTSIDHVLMQNFHAGLKKVEKRDLSDGADAIEEWLRRHPDAVAVSSHTAQVKPVVVDGVAAFQFVFLRHPLDRLQSVYLFERRQRADAFGPNLAKATDLRGYVRVRLDRLGDLSVRNFQTNRIAHFVADDTPRLQRAATALLRLGFVGVVEEFDSSLFELERRIRAFGFGEFRAAPVHANRTERAGDLQQRIADVEEALGPEMLAEFVEANADDFRLHELGLAQLANATEWRTAENRSPLRAVAARPTVFQYWHESELPADAAPLVQRWRDVPGFDHVLYDDAAAEKLVAENFDETTLSAFRQCALPSMRADMFRVCALAKYGGIYVDLGTEPIGDIAALWNSTARGVVLRREPDSGGGGVRFPTGFILLKSAGDPLMAAALARVTTNVLERVSDNLWVVTGPGVITALFNSGPSALIEGIDVRQFLEFTHEMVRWHRPLSWQAGTRHWSEQQKTESIFRDPTTQLT